MAAVAKIHIVDKENNVLHYVVSCNPTTPSDVAQGHILARTALISLTSNNLSYARGGTARNWWDAYRVPASLPAPYNDRSKYGIVPTWGYGEVVASRVPGLEIGTLLWGFWPSHGEAVDLQLVPDDLKGHWSEVSKTRSGLMSYYSRYQETNFQGKISDLSEKELEKLAWETVFLPLFACGFWISRYLLGSEPVHPFGAPGGVWTVEDADVRKAVVVSLSASGKTARAFTDSLLHARKPGTGPLGFLAITSKPDAAWLTTSSLPSKAVSYAQSVSSDTLHWISARKPHRIVIVDFGGRAGSLGHFMTALKAQLPDISIKIIGVGAPATVMPTELEAFSERVQMNTSGVREVLIEKYGAEFVFGELDEAWKAFERREFSEGLKLHLGTGVDGFEAGWRELCEGRAGEIDGMAYRMNVEE